MFCSLVARVVSLACLIGIARCLEAFHCVTELVFLHNRCQTVPLNEHFWGIYLQFVKYCGTQQGVVNLPSLPHFTVHFPWRLPLGSVSHSTPDVGSPPDLDSLSKQLRSVSQTDATSGLQIVLIASLSHLICRNVPR